MNPKTFSVTDAYIAGFFDGEGHVCSQSVHGGAPTVQLRLSQKTESVLVAIQAELGYGRVSQDNRGSYHLVITGKDDVRRFIIKVLPYSIVKYHQLKLAYNLCSLIGLGIEHHPKRWRYHNRIRRAIAEKR